MLDSNINEHSDDKTNTFSCVSGKDSGQTPPRNFSTDFRPIGSHSISKGDPEPMLDTNVNAHSEDKTNTLSCASGQDSGLTLPRKFTTDFRPVVSQSKSNIDPEQMLDTNMNEHSEDNSNRLGISVKSSSKTSS